MIDNKAGFIKVYVDGDLIQEMVMAPGDTPGTPAQIWMGGTPENYQWINGTVDDVAFFNAALDIDDIKNIMKNGLTKSFAVDPSGKLPETWANIKIR